MSLLLDYKMKPYLVLCLVCMIHEISGAITVVNFTPTLSSDIAVPVTSNTVSLKKPFCYFNQSCNSGLCTVWLVAARDSAINTFDSDKTAANFLALSPYPTAFNAGMKQYFMTQADVQNSMLCPASPPPNFLVGAQGACTDPNCNGLLPEGSTMRFKYFLVDSNNQTVAETQWSDPIALKTIKNPDSLASGYAGRSAAMVVITTILSVAAALLLLLLLIGLILACCCSKGKAQSYETRRQPSMMGSLRIPSYDVHHLKDPSPYDNPAYEQELKKRYTTNSTLPQKTTTLITTVQTNSPDTVIHQKM